MWDALEGRSVSSFKPPKTRDNFKKPWKEINRIQGKSMKFNPSMPAKLYNIHYQKHPQKKKTYPQI